MREQFRNFHAALAVFFKLALGPAQRRFGFDKGIALIAHHGFWNRLAMHLDEFWLVVKEFQLAWPARHIQENYALRSGREHRRARRHGVRDGGEETLVEQRCQRDDAGAAPAVLEEVAAGCSRRITASGAVRGDGPSILG